MGRCFHFAVFTHRTCPCNLQQKQFDKIQTAQIPYASIDEIPFAQNQIAWIATIILRYMLTLSLVFFNIALPFVLFLSAKVFNLRKIETGREARNNGLFNDAKMHDIIRVWLPLIMQRY
jgi:hypothetical protein